MLAYEIRFVLLGVSDFYLAVTVLDMHQRQTMTDCRDNELVS